MAEINFEVRGIPLSVEEEVFDDYRTLRLFARIRKDDTFAAVELFERVFGEEQVDNLIEQLEQDGTCKASDFVEFAFEAIDEAAKASMAGESKN